MRQPIAQGVQRVDALRHHEPDGDGRIEVTGNPHRGGDHDGENQPVREGRGHKGIHVGQGGRHDGRPADEDEREDADELGGEMTPRVTHWGSVFGEWRRLAH